MEKGKVKMDHPKCVTCRHFKPNADDWDNPLNLGECKCIAESWEMSKWDDEMNDSVVKDVFKGHLAATSDGSAYRADLRVHADFYCAMHSDILPNITPYSEYNG